MIWFSCSQCNKVHGRPDNAVGAMVFCTCGNGMTVPWESTASEPAHVPAVDLPAARVEPLSFGGPPRPIEPAPLPPPRASRRRGRVEPNANVCFNHEGRPRQQACADCGLSFCDDCVVRFRGQVLCGPCKNYAIRLLQRSPKTSGLAFGSLVAAFVAALLILLSPSARLPVFLVLAMISILFQALAFVAGLFAWRSAQADPGVGGQGAAITGMTAAAFMTVFTVALTMYLARLGS